MPKRVAVLFLTVLIFTPLGYAKKKKQVLPDLVLNAQTLVVTIHPDAGEPLTDLSANRTAQENVERALTKWGRFRLLIDVQTADLVVAVRTGHASGATIRNAPSNNRPVIIQPSDENVRIGGQQGRPPDATDPSLGGTANRDPKIASEWGSADDTLEVYRGRIEYPLDAAPLWRYAAKNALKEPQVTAVEQFRKIVEESEKQRQQKP